MLESNYGELILESRSYVCSLQVSLVLSLFKLSTDKLDKPNDVEDILFEHTLACMYNASILFSDLVLTTAKEQDMVNDTTATAVVDISSFPFEIVGFAYALSTKFPNFNIELHEDNKKVTCSFTDVDVDKLPKDIVEVVHDIELLRRSVFTSGLIDLIQMGLMGLPGASKGYSKPVKGKILDVCCKAGLIGILSSLVYDVIAGISFGAEYMTSEKLSPDTLDLFEYVFNNYGCFKAEVRDSEEDPTRKVFSVEFALADKTKGEFNRLIEEKMSTVEFSEVAKDFLTKSKCMCD